MFKNELKRDIIVDTFKNLFRKKVIYIFIYIFILANNKALGSSWNSWLIMTDILAES